MRRMREHCKRVGVVVTAVSMLTTPAWAQAPKAAPHAKATDAQMTAPMRRLPAANPKKLLASAHTKRAAGDFEGALADYQAADAVAPAPETIEGIAFCHDKLGHFDEALTWYEGFLANVPPAMELAAVDAKARVVAIKAMPGVLHLESVPSNAMVSVDGKEQLKHTPLDLELAPGKHTLHLTVADHDPLDKDVEIASRVKSNLVLEPLLTPPPPPPPPPVVLAPLPPPPPPPRSIVPAIVVGSLALVGARIGAGFGVSALNYKSSFNSNPTTATANSGESAALVSDMGFGIAITLGVTAIILYTTRNEPTSPLPTAAPPAPTNPTNPTPAPAEKAAATAPAITFAAAPFMTPHGGGAGAILRF